MAVRVFPARRVAGSLRLLAVRVFGRVAFFACAQQVVALVEGLDAQNRALCRGDAPGTGARNALPRRCVALEERLRFRALRLLQRPVLAVLQRRVLAAVGSFHAGRRACLPVAAAQQSQ